MEPRVHGFAVFLRIPVRRRAHEQADVLFRPQQLVQPSQPGVCLDAPPHVEEVLLLGQQDHGLGRHGGDEVVVIESQRQRFRRALFGVGGKFVLHVPPKRRDETRGGGHRPAALDAAQPGRHRAPARVAGDADVFRVDLFTCQQIIECADAVPGAPGGEVLTHEKLLIARLEMLARAHANGRLEVLVGVLNALPLPQRIENQDDVPLSGQPLGERLIRLGGFPIGRMPARADDARSRPALAFGKVQVRGHQKTGTTLEQNVFDAVGIAFEGARGPWIEGRLFRPGAEALVDPTTDRLYVRLGVRLRLERRLGAESRLLRLPYLTHEVLLNHPRETVQRRNIRLRISGRQALGERDPQ